MKIAICVTTRNREKETKLTLDSIKKYMPPNSKLFVVDDASDTPHPEADHRFDINVGVPKAKNKCIELAMDWEADQVFLVDNDVIFLQDKWWKPYVDNPEPHLQAEFVQFATGRQTLKDNKVIYENGSIAAYGHARGYLLYYDKICFETVGGFDVRYEKGLYEHGDLSNRIFNAGLTSFRFQDVPNSQELFKSLDQYRETKTSIDPMVRATNLRKFKDHFANSWISTEYCEYREKPKPNPVQGDKNIVLTSYLTKQTDTQRNINWTPDKQDIEALKQSVEKHGHEIVILNDCFDDDETFIQSESLLSPYFQRWLNQYRYLRDHPEIDNVWVVDATDVEMLNDPFPEMQKGVLYVGDEPSTLANRWLITNSRSKILMRYFRTHPRLPLLNCGVVGGSRQDVMQLCHDVFAFYVDNGLSEPYDMQPFNYVVYTKWRERIEHGRKVTNVFKSYDKTGDSWFAHK